MKHFVCSALAVACLALPLTALAQQTGTHIKKLDKVIVHTTLSTQKSEPSKRDDKALRAMPELPVIIEEADESVDSGEVKTQAE
jgi:hypothetical protein